MKHTIIIASLVAAVSVAATTQASFAKDRKGPRFDFTQFDTDGDKLVTKAEVIAFQTKNFTEADADGDGALTKTEAAALFEARGNNSGRDKSERRMGKMFSHLDENDDDALSLAELVKEERVDRMFERLDSDEDGAISEEEAEKMRAERGKRHGSKDKNSRS